MSDFDDADEALAAALGDTPSQGQVAPEDGPGAALTLADPSEGEGSLVPESEWLCTEDEARALVDRTKAAITELDDSLRAIIERRAWEPLGYPSPREFVLSELGPSAPGGKSRAQAYRLARVAMFLYGLAEAFGEDSVLLDISERGLRSIPAGPNGVNDEVLTERVAARITSTPDITDEQAQAVWDEELARARDEYASTGRLARGDESGGGWGGDGDWDRDDDGDEYQEDTFDVADITAPTPSGDGEDPAPWETQSSSRLDFVDAHGVGDKPSSDAVMYVQALVALLGAFAVIAANSQHLPDIVEYASDEQITQAAEAAHTTQEMTAAVIAEASARDETFTLG